MPIGRPKEFDEAEALAGAMEVFWAKGYDGAGIAALTAAMGIGRQSLYDTFGDKRALYVRAVDAYVRDRMGPVLELLHAPGAGRDALEAVLDGWVSKETCGEDRGCFLAGAASGAPLDDDEVAGVVKGHVDALEAGFRKVLERVEREGSLTLQGPPRQVARTLTSLSLGLGTLGRLKAPSAYRRDVVASARALVGLG